MKRAFRSLVDVLVSHAAERPHADGYRLLGNGEQTSATRSYAELDRRARVVASWLHGHGLTGKTVLLLLQDDLGFIDAFAGCLYAGVVPVPVAVPRPNRPLHALHAIGRSAGIAAVIIGSPKTASLRNALGDELAHAAWLDVEDAQGDPGAYRERALTADDLAFLQYTSGSTGTPKGVMVTHGNLMDNQAAIQHSMRLSRESSFVGWLPLFHDMGLIGNVLQSWYLGIPCTLMPPVAFLQRPLRWVQAISTYRATVSGAPNFAYDLCVDRTTPEDRAALDLSSWSVAFNGSEPVRAATLERFAAAFAPAGFRRTSLYPCYGMAETTLLATGVVQGSEPMLLPVDAAALAQGRVQPPAPGAQAVATLVGCGETAPGTTVVIADPHGSAPLPAGAVGEVWVAGGSVAAGYYNLPEATEQTFGARLAGSDDGPFLRTGDLGFLQDGHLFVTGRIKDVIIVRGRNHYPHDLELTAARSNALLAPGGGAAVALEDGGQPSVVIVHELTREGWRTADPERVEDDVREAVALDHGIRVSRVLLIRPGNLPRTTSGKVRRSTCRAMVESGAFETLQPGARDGDAVLEVVT